MCASNLELKLGKPFYKYAGCEVMPSKALLESNHSAYEYALMSMKKPSRHGLGICSMCGTAITSLFYIESSDGVISTLGSECVKKYFKNNAILMSKVENDEKNIAKAKAKEEKISLSMDVHEFIEDNIDVLRKLKYPMSKNFESFDEAKKKWYLENVIAKKSLYDYALESDICSNAAGKKKLLEFLKTSISENKI